MALWPLIELLGYLKDGVTRALTIKGEVTQVESIAVDLNRNEELIGEVRSSKKRQWLDIDRHNIAWTMHSFPIMGQYNSGGGSGIPKLIWGGIDNFGKQFVRSYNYETKENVVVELSDAIKDDHCAVVVTRLPNYKMIVMYTEHSNTDTIKYRISTNNWDISSLGVEKEIGIPGGGLTYINIHTVMQIGQPVRVISRNAGDGWYVWSSTDNAETFGTPVKLVDDSVAAYCDCGKRSENYTVSTRLGIALTTDISQHGNIHFVEMDLDGKIYTADGIEIADVTTGIGLPLTLGANTLVYDGITASREVRVTSVFGNTGTTLPPMFTFITLSDTGTVDYKIAVYETDTWNVYNVVSDVGGSIAGPCIPAYTGNLSLSSISYPKVSIYASVKINGQWEIIHYYTRDVSSGLWNIEPVTQNSSVKNFRPIVPYNTRYALNSNRLDACAYLKGYYTDMWYYHTELGINHEMPI